jgi:hypothetical protein
MDLNMPVSERAKIVLKKLVEVEGWAKSGDPRAKPYLDNGAVRIVAGKAEFHRDRFFDVYADELFKEAK